MLYMQETLKQPKPPLRHELTSYHEQPDGRVTSVGIFVMDSMGETYSLELGTADAVAARMAAEEDSEFDPADREPVFVVPGDRINPDDIDTVLGGISPELLGKFVVLQEGDNDSVEHLMEVS